MDAAASMAEALSEGTGYFAGSGMRFELDTGWGSGDAEILLNLANNSKGKSYGEFLSTNTSYIDEVDMTVKDRTDPYEMQRFIASLKDYRQDIEDEAERLGDDSVLTSAEYESLVAQIKDAEEAFGQLNTAIDNLNAIEAERILLAQEGLDTLTYSSYEGLRNKYSDQISKYLEG
jgi:hypothetical protein